MQATVRIFDPATRSGTVLADDGREFPFGTEAFDRGGLRLLRSGQRVRVVFGPEGADAEPRPGAAQAYALTVLTLAATGEGSGEQPATRAG